MDEQTKVMRWGQLARLLRAHGDKSNQLVQALRQRCQRLITTDRRWLSTDATVYLKDTTAGLVASVVLIGNIVSFGALMFPGKLSAGIPIAVWAMLIGAAIAGIWIALRTSLSPMASGIDSPTGAVLVVLSATVGHDVLAAGGSPEVVIPTVMLLFTAATVVSGLLFFGLGVLRWGSYLRFVPYFVVGGFLAATGWFLFAGGIRMTIGRALSFDELATWTWIDTAKLACSVGALAVLLMMRRVKNAFALPGALLVMWIGGAVVLRSLGLSGVEHGWYLPSLNKLTVWSPFAAARTTHITWPMLGALVPELVTVTIVSLISLVTKVSSIEVSRQTSGDIDRELRAHGIGNLLAAPVGGLTASLQVGSSRLLELAGASTRMSGAVSGIVLGIVAISSFDLPGLIPIPVIAGLVFYLGYTFMTDALLRPYVQKAWLDLCLAVAIMAVCVQYGYLVGVLVGIVCACIFFAVSYARVGVVRRHMTRGQFASNVYRSAAASRYLREAGQAIQLYWLSGYIFFGSSEGVFERVRDDVESLPPLWVSYVILDFGMVSGTDASAVVSLAKLSSFCQRQGLMLIMCSLSPENRRTLELRGLLGGKSRNRYFSDLNLALIWCEDQLLHKAKVEADTTITGFETWLQSQLGASAKSSDFLTYLVRRDIEARQTLYREGDPADSIDLVASGSLAVNVTLENGQSVCIRRIATQAVLGEMGFFRRAVRSATVSSDGPAVLFTLTRENFERMRRDRPDLASAFDDFILRILSDRIDFANREVVALSR
jgi:sulfate permease, SulP family